MCQSVSLTTRMSVCTLTYRSFEWIIWRIHHRLVKNLWEAYAPACRMGDEAAELRERTGLCQLLEKPNSR